MQTIGRSCSYEPSWRPRYRGTAARTIASPSYSAAQVGAGAPLPVHEGDELAAIPERGLTGVDSFGVFPSIRTRLHPSDLSRRYASKKSSSMIAHIEMRPHPIVAGSAL